MFDTNTKMDELFVQHLFLICLVIFFFSFLSFITIILEISGETFAQHISQDLALIVDHILSLRLIGLDQSSIFSNISFYIT